MVEPPIAFLPSFRPSIPKLLAEVFTYQRVRIYLPWLVRIFAREQSSPSEPGQKRTPLCRTQIGQGFGQAGDGRRFKQRLERLFVRRPVKKA